MSPFEFITRNISRISPITCPSSNGCPFSILILLKSMSPHMTELEQAKKHARDHVPVSALVHVREQILAPDHDLTPFRFGG